MTDGIVNEGKSRITESLKEQRLRRRAAERRAEAAVIAAQAMRKGRPSQSGSGSNRDARLAAESIFRPRPTQ